MSNETGDEMNNNIIFCILVVCIIFSIFCGIALCIHVHGVHWANQEIQKAININKASLLVD